MSVQQSHTTFMMTRDDLLQAEAVQPARRRVLNQNMRLWLGQMPACSGLSDTSPAERRERQNQGRRGEDRGGDCVGLPEAEPVGRQASDR